MRVSELMSLLNEHDPAASAVHCPVTEGVEKKVVVVEVDLGEHNA